MFVLTEPIPISVYVKRKFAEPLFTELILNIPIKITNLENIAIRYLEEMGMYMVDQNNAHSIEQLIIHVVKYSPEIGSMTSKAQESEKRRKEKKHDI